MKKISLILLLIASSTCVWAYPNFVGFGYQSCLTCHYNPYGKGPLNDYGRAVSASVIADRLFVPDSISDEKLGDRSGFLLGYNPIDFLRPAYDRRYAYLEVGAGKEGTQYSNFTMQNDYTVTMKFGQGDQYIATGTWVEMPMEQERPGRTESYTFSREHYIGGRFFGKLGVYLGKMDKLFGIRIPDHNAVSRRSIGLDQDSQVHSALINYITDAFEFGYQYIIGDREKKPEEHTEGHAAMVEYNFSETIRLGTSFLIEKNTELEQSSSLFALFSKIQVGKGSSILAELGTCTSDYLSGCRDSADTDKQVSGVYSYLQSSVNLRRGLFFTTTLQTQKVDNSQNTEVYRFGPGIQWFPIQRLEFRFDLDGQKTYADTPLDGGSQEESWNFLGQLHIWL